MKRKSVWILSILLAAAAITILVIALLRGGGDPNKTEAVEQTLPPLEETAAPASEPAATEPEAPAPSPTEEPIDEISADGRAAEPTPEPGQQYQGSNWNPTPEDSGGSSQEPTLEGQDEDELPMMP